MKKSGLIIFCCAAFLVLAISPAMAFGSSPKIGYFDLQTVLDKSSAGKRAKASFESEQKAVKSGVEEKSREFEKMKQDFEKKKSLMDDKAKQEKMMALRKAQAEGEQTVAEAQNTLVKKSQELTKPIVDKILDIVRELGKKDDYDLILEVQKSGIAYATEKADLTDKVLKELNKVMP